MRFSLIVATLGRIEEVKELLCSLELQTFRSFEVIVVDQNPDNRLAWLQEAGRYPFPVLHRRSKVRHSSIARNLGLKTATGDIVAFPDDDCTYPPELLANIDRAFKEAPNLGVLTGPIIGPSGSHSIGGFEQVSRSIDKINVWHSAAEANLFIRRQLVVAADGFDEKLGIGGIFGSAEANDLVLRVLETGCVGWYDPTLVVLHPERPIGQATVKRAFSYGAGCGYAMRKNHTPSKVWLKYMIRPLGGCVLSLLRGRLGHADYYWRSFCGRLYGFTAYHKASKQHYVPHAS